MIYYEMSAREIDDYLKKLHPSVLEGELDVLRWDLRASTAKIFNKYRNKADKYSKEVARIINMSKYENHLFEKNIYYVAGVDEAGRGPLAGAVFAAAVIFPPHTIIEGVNDSKKLSCSKREYLAEIIKKEALAYSITSVDHKEIDRINIKKASEKAMINAVKSLSIVPQHVLLDGMNIPDFPFPHTSIIRGDNFSMSIAAASILAKVARDQYIIQMDSVYPQYNFKKHKGYGTKEHIEYIRAYGICDIHRESFTRKFV